MLVLAWPMMAMASQAKCLSFVIDTRNNLQTMEHFGASDCWSMQHVGRWNERVQQQVADWLFSTENDSSGKPKGIGLSLWRFNVGAGSAEQGEESQIGSSWTRSEGFMTDKGDYDWNKLKGQRRFLKLAKERGVPHFLAFLNSPPVRFTQNGLATNTGRGGTLNLKEEHYLDFARYMADVVQGVERHDGIHFDYIRYPEHSPKFPDKDTYRRYGQQQDWKDWRRNNITRIVRRLYTDIKRLKPWVKVSSSPVGKYNDTRRYTSKGWNAYDIVFQDAQLWIQQGIHDALFPMMYFQGNHFYPFAIDWKEHDNHRWIVPGLGIYFLHPSEGKWKLDEVVRQLYFLRSIQADGQAYFRNRFLMDNTQGLMDEIKDEFYTAPAVWPAMTWQDSIPPTVPTGPTLRFEDGVTQLGWNASTDNSIPFSVYYRIYASNSYPVDTEQASTLVEARVADTCFTYRPSAPWLQKIYWAVTAVDRYGNESQPLALNAPTDLQPEVLQQLPSIPEGGTLIIADLTGKEILRLTNDTAPFEKLGTGFYRVSLKTSDGKIHLLGTILR